MKMTRISPFPQYQKATRTWHLKDRLGTLLAGLVGAFFGLLMGMTALAALLGVESATEAGRPGLLLIKVIVVGTFVLLSVILFTHRFGEEEEEEEEN